MKLWTGIVLLGALANPLAAGESKRIVLGITGPEAARREPEFRQYGRMKPLYAKNRIEACLLDVSLLLGRDAVGEEALFETLRRYHVVHLTTTSDEPALAKPTPELLKRAETVGRALARYVREGGGLFIQARAPRRADTADQAYWNRVMKPFGLQMLQEGVFDKAHRFDDYVVKIQHYYDQGVNVQRQTQAMAFWHTRNIQRHPVTAGVKRLYLPLTGAEPVPGLVAMTYSDDWQAVVRGEKEAKSYRTGKEGQPTHANIEADGTYQSAPPVVAVRSFGKGRIVSYPISPLFTGTNYGNPLWTQVVETAGDAWAGRRSDSMKLQMNAYRWLSGPAMPDAAFGTYRPGPYRRIAFPKAVAWDQPFPKVDAGTGIRGIMGAHTAYTDGKGTVADYVSAAKAAGLSFIVFNDPLEKLTPETLAKLKADCTAINEKTKDFYACPGIEFTDGTGNRWAFWNERIVYPEKSYKRRQFRHTNWDGKRVHLWGRFAERCGYGPSALLDYKQLPANKTHRENLWWFYHYLPLTYDRDKLIADNHREWLWGLRDMRWSAVASFTRITDPADVALAARTCTTSFTHLHMARQALNTVASPYEMATEARQYVTQGPSVLVWEAKNAEMKHNWRYTRGAQRVRLNFVVGSQAGIRDVKVHDADRGIVRRFAGKGGKWFGHEFELVHDRQHYLTLEVTDTLGKRAISHYIQLYSRKQGLFRGEHNHNTWDNTGLVWHPETNKLFPMVRPFRNAENFQIQGWDKPLIRVPTPLQFAWEWVQLQSGVMYPSYMPDSGYASRRADLGKMSDVALAGHNIQIVSMEMTRLAEDWYERAERAHWALASPPRDLRDSEYFERSHTMYSPMERADFYVIEDHGRRREGIEKYRGSLTWHEGEFRFKKDTTLKTNVPIPLVMIKNPCDPARGWGSTFVVTDRQRGTRVTGLTDPTQPIRVQGRIRPGGYAAWMNSSVGYYGFLTPPDEDMDFGYDVRIPHKPFFGLGHDGMKVTAGTVLKYRFAFGAFADGKVNNELLEHTIKALNMRGGTGGYPIEMKIGTVADAVFFFTAKAKAGEAVFSLGPQNLMIDLPIRVRGLADNGCVAVYSTPRRWFRFVPVVQGAAYFQEPIDAVNRMWVGNVFLCDHEALNLTLVVDGQAEGRDPFIEVHNPTTNPITTTLRSPPHTPRFGGLSTPVTVPPGTSIRLRINGKVFEPM